MKAEFWKTVVCIFQNFLNYVYKIEKIIGSLIGKLDDCYF